MIARAAYAAWRLWALPAERRLRAALADPERAQQHRLRKLLHGNAHTRIGHRLGLGRVRSVDDFRARIPVTTYDDYGEDVEAIRGGVPRVLTAEPVRRLVPSSGSTGALKLVPYTAALQSELAASVGPWLADILRRYPGVGGGPAYWSVSPAIAPPAVSSGIPVGFDSDAGYLGDWAVPVLSRVLAVPDAVRDAGNLDAFRYCCLRLLLGCSALRLISVWHPSFLTLLWAERRRYWDAIVDDVEEGTLRPPGEFAPRAVRALRVPLRPAPNRARTLRALGPDAPFEALWPGLSLVSAWGDAAAAGPFEALGAALPAVALQPKGLLATEGCVSIPYAGTHPLAVSGHVIELRGEDGVVVGPEGGRVGARYEVLLTTGGGLVRYRLGDVVEVTGRLAATPTVRFVGRADATVDLVGEKLSEAFVEAVLQKLLPGRRRPALTMLAPDATATPRGYTLYVDRSPEAPDQLLRAISDALRENPHFAYASDLGQLGPLRMYLAGGGASERYLERLRREGRRLGDIKPTALQDRDDWSEVFDGRYLCESPARAVEGRTA